MPLEIRFLHNPKATEGFVGCALYGKVFRFYKTRRGDWDAEMVMSINHLYIQFLFLYMVFNMVPSTGEVISNCLRDDIWMLEDMKDAFCHKLALYKEGQQCQKRKRNIDFFDF